MKKIPVLKYPVTVTAARVVVPVYIYNYSEAEQVFLIISYIQNKKLAPLATTGGYRRHLNANISNEKVLSSWKRNLCERHSVDLAWVYVNLYDFYEFGKRVHTGFWGHIPVDFKSNFEYYLKQNVTIYEDSWQTEKSVNEAIKEYVRYLPYLQEKFKAYGDYQFGHCCEDCDGTLTDYQRSRVESDISSIVASVPKFINVDFPVHEQRKKREKI